MLAGLQMLRAIAAILVVVHHLLEELRATSLGLLVPDYLVRVGAVGVDLFFLISGFIMYYTTQNEKVRSKAFLFARLARIYPPYLAVLALVLLLHSTGYFYRSLDISVSGIIRSVFLLPTDSLVVGVAWTLVYEMYFYVLFSLSLMAPRRYLLPVLSALLVIGYSISGYIKDSALQSFLSNPVAFEFLLGVLAAIYYHHLKTLNTPFIWLLASVLVVTMASAWLPNEGTVGLEGWGRFFGWGIGSMGIFLFFLSLDSNGFNVARIWLVLGASSYALYLTHPLFMTIAAKAFTWNLTHSFNVFAFFTALIVSILFGLFYYYHVERKLCAYAKSML